jgi:PAS domain S-box-containing protein
MNEFRLDEDLDRFLYDSPYPWWEWNVPENLVKVSPLKVTNIGYDPDDFAGAGYQAYTSLLHEEDFERAMDAMRDLLEGRTPIYQVDYRIRAADGTYHWYMDRGVAIQRLPDGSPAVVRGVVLDLGDHLDSEASFAEVLALFRRAVPAAKRTETHLAICSGCLSMRSGSDEWMRMSDDLAEFIDMPKTHSLCIDCLRALYPDMADQVMARLGEVA